MAHNDDTNVASRGGLHGLRWLRRRAALLLAQGGSAGRRVWRACGADADCIARNLSPAAAPTC